jgi:hypothetical protein
VRWFVLQAADPETGCPAFETRLVVDDVSALRGIIGAEANPDADLTRIHPLDDHRLAMIADTFGVRFERHGRDVVLEPWHRLRELPYLVHAGFELPLMLEGKKPLAYFFDQAEWLHEYLKPFERFVVERRIVKRVVESETDSGAVIICFALPGEQWRIDALLALRKRGAASGWNETMEREEGRLLGYSTWENDRWAEWRAGFVPSAHSRGRR